jgi:xanthine/uracil permease
VLGGITVVLYGMIGLLGAKIWIENRVDFGNPSTSCRSPPASSSASANTTLQVTDDFELSGIALGTIVVIVGYHLAGPSAS